MPAEHVLQFIGPGQDLIVPLALGEPSMLMDALEANAGQLDGVRVHQMDPFTERRYMRGEFGDRLRHVSYYLGPGDRKAYWNGSCELVPNHFSEVPWLLRQLAPDALVLAMASGPDDHGYFSLGTNADYISSLIGQRPFFLEVNPNVPFTYGQNAIHISQIVGWTRSEYELALPQPRATTAADHAIAGFVAEMIPNGACLQVGVGSVPDALMHALRDHRDLGIHTECLSDGLMDLVLCGAANGSRKVHMKNKHVSTFALGGKAFMDWIDNNPSVQLMPVEWTNDPRKIAREPNFRSINATTEVDLMGQAASETIAGRYWSSSGGQADFARGAMYADGGMAFLVLHATTRSGASKIRAQLSPGSVVTTLKNTVDHVVTEYGIAALRGRSLRERADALISIAHPDHRDELRHDAKKFGLLH